MEMDKQDWQVYMKHINDDAKKPISWKEKQKRWQEYLKSKKKKATETSFNMNKYQHESNRFYKQSIN